MITSIRLQSPASHPSLQPMTSENQDFDTLFEQALTDEERSVGQEAPTPLVDAGLAPCDSPEVQAFESLRSVMARWTQEDDVSLDIASFEEAEKDAHAMLHTLSQTFHQMADDEQKMLRDSAEKIEQAMQNALHAYQEERAQTEKMLQQLQTQTLEEIQLQIGQMSDTVQEVLSPFKQWLETYFSGTAAGASASLDDEKLIQEVSDDPKDMVIPSLQTQPNLPEKRLELNAEESEPFELSLQSEAPFISKEGMENVQEHSSASTSSFEPFDDASASFEQALSEQSDILALPEALEKMSQDDPLVQAMPEQQEHLDAFHQPKADLGERLASESMISHQLRSHLMSELKNKEGRWVLRLDPPHLGALAIRLERSAEGMHLEMAASSTQTERLLQEHLQTLKHALSHQGLALGDVQIFSEGRSQQGDEQQSWVHETGIWSEQGQEQEEGQPTLVRIHASEHLLDRYV